MVKKTFLSIAKIVKQSPTLKHPQECQAYLDVLAAMFQYLQGNEISASKTHPFVNRRAPSISEFVEYLRKNPLAIQKAFILENDWNPMPRALYAYNPHHQASLISASLDLDPPLQQLLNVQFQMDPIVIGSTSIWAELSSSSNSSEFIKKDGNVTWLGDCRRPMFLERPTITAQHIDLNSYIIDFQHRICLSNGRVLTMDADSNVVYDYGKSIEIERHRRHRIIKLQDRDEQLERRVKRTRSIKLFENDSTKIQLQNRFAPLETLADAVDVTELPDQSESDDAVQEVCGMLLIQ